MRLNQTRCKVKGWTFPKRLTAALASSTIELNPQVRLNAMQNHVTRARIPIPLTRIGEFCRRHRIRRLALFGWVIRDDFGPESDVDVLVEFEPGATPGFFGLSRMEHELSTLMGGRRAEISTPEMLSKYFKDDVLRSAEVLYDAA